MIDDPEGFIRANTALQPVPHAPEISLYVADEITPIWKMTESALGALGISPPFWAFAWAGGLGLARYVLDHPDAVRGQHVLDLATGCGVVALAAARAGAARVVVNDVDPLALIAARLNAAANGVRVVPMLGDLLSVAEPDPLDGVDVVLTGDVFYDRDLAAQVLPFLQRAAERGARVVVGDPGRRYLPRALLLPLERYEVPVPRDLEGDDAATVTVWWLPARAEPDA